jgi:catechol 2,3-dioxygenase-like lactoylglutathione lyase family enzyme
MSPDTTPLVSHTDFVMIPTRDFEAACRFYGEVLGLPLAKRWGQMPGAEFETGNLTLAVAETEKFGMGYTPNANPIALRVDDVSAARERLIAADIEFMGDTIDSGVCHMAPFKDPDGNQLMLHHRYAPEE